MKYLVFAIILIFFAAFEAHAKTELSYAFDKENTLKDISDIIDSEPQLESLNGEYFNFGFVDEPIWIKISNPDASPKKLFLDNATFSYVDYYLVENQKVLKSIKTGTFRPFDSREDLLPNFTFNIPANHENSEVWLRIESDEDLHGSFRLLDINNYEKTVFENYLFGIVPIGITFTLILLYAVIFISLKEEIYLLYLTYAFSVFMVILRINGIGFYLFWPGIPEFNHYSGMFEAWPAITGGLFSAYFLRLKSFLPKIFKLILVMVGLQVVSLIICLAGFNTLSIQLTDLVATLFMPIAIASGIYVYFVKKYDSALYYLISWAFLLVGVSIFLGRNYGIIETDAVWMNHALEIGIAGEMVLLSIGVSQRIDYLRKSKIQIQSEINDMIKLQNAELEAKVTERTKILETQNKEIIAQQEEIQSMNDHLEEIISQRTKRLEENNRLLTEYAFFNAHKVRGPLARILGLLNLYKDGHESHISFLFSNIEMSAKELDKVIQDINKSLTDNENTPGEIAKKEIKNLSKDDVPD